MATNNIFKFVSLRPPRSLSKNRLKNGFVKFDNGNKSSLHKEIEALAGDDKRKQAVGIAKKYLMTNPVKDDLSGEIALVKAMTSLKKVKDAKKLAKRTLKDSITIYLGKKETKNKWEKLWNNIYAQSLTPNVLPNDRVNAFEGIKALKYLQIISEMQDGDKPPSLDDFQKIKLILPSGLIPEKILTNVSNNEFEQKGKKVVEKFKTLYTELKKSKAAVKDLRDTNIKFRALEQRKTAVEGNSLNQIGKDVFQDFKVIDLKTPLIRKSNSGLINVVPKKKDSKDIAISLEQTSVVVPSKKPWVLSDFGNSNLNLGTKETLKKFTKEFEELEAPQIVASLETKMFEGVKHFFETTPKEYLGLIAVLPEYREITSMVSLPFKIKPAKKPTVIYYYEAFVCNREVPIFGQSLKEKRTI